MIKDAFAYRKVYVKVIANSTSISTSMNVHNSQNTYLRRL